MATNRLLPHQFGPGITLDGTRIEQALRALIDKYNDVPADLVLRRWSPSPMVWGFTPAGQLALPAALPSPFLPEVNTTAGAVFEPPTTIYNPYRVKSLMYPGVESGDVVSRSWEVSFVPGRPVLVGSLTLLAEYQTKGAWMRNRWLYEAGAAAFGEVNNTPCKDITLQTCISDGWDVENRKKLHQESLVFEVRSDAFKNQADGFVPAQTTQPPHPAALLFPVPPDVPGVFRGFIVEGMPMVLVPAGARVHFILTIPEYADATASTWDIKNPDVDNAWNLHAQIWEATR